MYYFEPGSGSGALSFTVFLKGGGWCSSVDQSFGGFDSCLSRSKGSSANYPATMGVGYEGGVTMNDDPEVDPRFSIRKVAYLRYCDGASFTGNKAEPVPTPPREVHKNGPACIFMRREAVCGRVRPRANAT